MVKKLTEEQLTLISPNKLCWSPLPQESYTVSYDGGRAGIGLHPACALPGVWNLLWLSSALLDELPDFKGDIGTYPYSCAALPTCAGASFQALRPSAMKTIGHFADELNPHQFIQVVKEYRKDFLLPKVYTSLWWGVAELRAKTYVGGGNVIKVDFGRGR